MLDGFTPWPAELAVRYRARGYWRDARPIQEPRIDWDGASDRLAATELPVYMWAYGKLWPVAGLGDSARPTYRGR